MKSLRGKLTVLAMLIFLSGCDTTDNNHRVVGELMSERIEMSTQFAEPITAILVAEGAVVSAGTTLLTQDSSRAVAKRREAEAALGQAQARLDELIRGPRSESITAARASVEGATQEAEFRRSEQSRFEEIHRRGLASSEALDQANAALDAAEAELKLRLAQLEELLAGTTLEELAQAEHAVSQTAARRDAADVEVAKHSLQAPVDAIVDSRLFQIGEQPVAGQPAIILLADAQPHARVYVPEELRVKVSSGTRARIYVDGLDEVINGTVRVVASEAAFTPYYWLTERDRGRLSYVAKIDIDESRTRLPDGVPVEVEFDFD